MLRYSVMRERLHNFEGDVDNHYGSEVLRQYGSSGHTELLY